MHRERGLHLDEPEVTVDGAPVPAAHPRHRADAVLRRAAPRPSAGQGIYFYLPKLEAPAECALVPRPLRPEPRAPALPAGRDDPRHPARRVAARASTRWRRCSTRSGPYAAGLNAARWDLKASIFEFVMADPNVGVAGPLRGGHQDHAVPRQHLPPPGRGLPQARRRARSAAWPPRCPTPIPRSTAWPRESIRGRQGVGGRAGLHPRLGRPHLPHEDRGRSVQAAASPPGWKPTPEMADPGQLPGARSRCRRARSRSRARAATPAWSSSTSRAGCNGRGAKGIDSLAGKPGVHPALMEDLATGRMSVAQIAQRIRHRAHDDRGPAATPRLRAGQAAAPGGARRHPAPEPVNGDEPTPSTEAERATARR